MATNNKPAAKPAAKPKRASTSLGDKLASAIKGVVSTDPVEGGDDTAAVAGTYARDPARAEFFGFSRGNNVFSFDKNGDVISRKLVWPGEPAVAPVARHQFSLPMQVEGLKGHPRFPLGLIVVSGSTKAGKSTSIEALSMMMPLQRLLAVEPHDEPADVETVPTFSSADGALAAACSMMYANPKMLFAIDSLRAPLFETNGAAGEKGIIMPFFTQLTRVSSQLARAGMTVIVTINPMNDDDEYVRKFLGYLSASVPTLITIESARREGKDRIITGTVAMRPNRMPRRFTLDTRSRRRARDDMDDLISEIEFEPVGAGTNVLFPQSLINAIEKAE